ncbi:unnamed protein product [Callosobruchus maculatus]|uniref:TIL domain-containing protein n=1 Tax=Callosobruchus maculatus TaxID=64391 RepID=A0A653DCL7_CALMS|nr:unnamed protein product [Callosobruchus maculatus]
MKSLVLSICVLFVIVSIFETASARCGRNEHVPICRPCAVTCAYPNRICADICIPNSHQCYCKPGYLRKNGRCVPISQC